MQESPILARAWGELFQTERSAERHPLVEAERLGDVPPATALRAVSAHASAVLPQLERLAQARGHDAASFGRRVGELFSNARQKVADLALTQEMSYRGTLLGMRHGVDLVQMMAFAAEDLDPELCAWCAGWLQRRRALVEQVAKELSWFANNPAVAERSVAGQALSSAFDQA